MKKAARFERYQFTRLEAGSGNAGIMFGDIPDSDRSLPWGRGARFLRDSKGRDSDAILDSHTVAGYRWGLAGVRFSGSPELRAEYHWGHSLDHCSGRSPLWLDVVTDPETIAKYQPQAHLQQIYI